MLTELVRRGFDPTEWRYCMYKFLDDNSFGLTDRFALAHPCNWMTEDEVEDFNNYAQVQRLLGFAIRKEDYNG